MFDFAWSELALIGIVGLLVIGPKDMPVAIRTVTNMLKKGRKLAGEFQTHVDEMVREADLGDARDHIKQLRSFNVRGQIMKALDEDGSIKRTLTENPLEEKPLSAGPRFAPPTQSIAADDSTGVAAQPDQALTEYTVEARPRYGVAADHDGARRWLNPGQSEPHDAELDAGDPAPSIVPPRVARRLQAERARPPAPAFVPPGATRPHA